MAVNLEELVFKVDTQQLEAASKKLDSLATSLEAVGKATKAAGKTSGTTGGMEKPIEKVKVAADKVTASLENMRIKADLVNKGFSKMEAGQLLEIVKKTGEGSVQFKQMVAILESMRPAVKAVSTELEKQTEVVGKLRAGYMSVEERQKSITDFMTKGFSRGQASILTTAKNLGAVGDELARIGVELQTQRKLQGGDPFDKSASGLLGLKNRYTELREANRQYIKDTQLTRDQTRELARDKERLIIKLKQEGAGFQEIRAVIREHNQAFLEAANRVNGLTKVEADLERQLRETANSVRALAREEEKVDSIVNSLTGSTNTHTKTSERAAESIARYERNLRLAGVSGEQAAAKLEIYRKKINQIQVIEEQRKSRLLSNSLAPQISDVVVSLAGGQNPLTVALQQGLQVRDLIGLSGVAAEELQKVFATAASSMINSLAQTGKAIGSLLIGSIQSAGAAVIKFGSEVTGTDFILGKLRKNLEGFPKLTKVFDGFATLARFGAGGGIAAAAAALISLGVALKQTINQEDALAKALTLSGASMGLSQTQALEYAASMQSAGVTTSTAIKVFQEMAKQSSFTAGQFFVVAEAAANMEKYVGVSIEDTVKAYGKLTEKPLESLLELAKATGLVAPEIIKVVAELERQGKTAEATSLAITTMADVNEQQVARMKEDYNGLSLFLINLATSIKSFYDDVFRSLFTKASPKEAIKKQLGAVNEILDGAGAAGMLGIGNYFGREFYENQRNELSKQLLLMEKVEQVETDRVTTNRELAMIQGEAEKITSASMDAQTKYLTKINELSNKIVKARALGASEDTISALQSGITKAADDYEKSLKKPEKTRRTPEESFMAKSMKEFINNTVEASFAQDELSKSQLKVLKIVQDPLWSTLKEDQKLRILGLFEEAYAAEELNKTLEVNKAARAAALKEDFEAQAKRLDQMADFDIVSRDANEALMRENEDLVFQSSLIGKTAEERKKLIEIKKIEIALEKELAEIRRIYKDDPSLNSQLEQAAVRAQQRIANIAKQSAIDTAQAFQTSVSDAIETALFEGGKAGSKKLRDIIVAELRKPIRVFIEAVVGNITGAIFGGGSGGGSAGIGSGTTAGGGGGIAGLATAYDFIKGGLNAATSAGQGLATLMAKTVSQFGASTFTNLTTQFASGMMSTGSMAAASQAFTAGGAQLAGVIGGSILNGFSGYGISKMLSGGYSAGNGVNTLAGIASMIPGIGPIAGVVGGLVNRAFGRKAPVTTGQDLRGTFSTTGANVAQYQTNFSKGGWFRSNKTTVTQSAVSAEFDKYLDTSLQAITATTKQFASILGLIPEAIDGVVKSINISLLGLNAEQQQAAIQNAFGGFSDALAMQLLGSWETTSIQVKKSFGERYIEALTKGLMSGFGQGKEYMNFSTFGGLGAVDPYKTVTTTKWTPGEFVREGETAFGALTRLATSLVTVNGVFDTLNTTLMHASLIGADAASSLLDAFGGVEIFNNLTTAYYNEYYTAQEKVATTTRQLSKIFEGMGLTLPTTRDGFRMLVEAQDLYTDEGRATYAALLNLAPAFASITSAVEQFTTALIDEVRRLRGEIVGASGATGVDYLKQQFTDARTAAAGGDANALEQLPSISQALVEAVKLQANSSADIVRIQAWLAQGLTDTSTTLGQPIPAFATGGMHSGGARIVGENGPELEITGASRIYNASQTASMFGGGGNLESLLVTLNDNISGLRAEVRADVAVNAKTAKLLDRVIPEGDAITIAGIDGGAL